MTPTYGKILAAVLAASTFVSARASEVDRREAHQQARIAQGVQRGQLGPRETVRLERREARTHREIRRDRAAHGGRLTRAERARVNREENRTSHRIERARHDHRRG